MQLRYKVRFGRVRRTRNEGNFLQRRFHRLEAMLGLLQKVMRRVGESLLQ